VFYILLRYAVELILIAEIAGRRPISIYVSELLQATLPRAASVVER
jgi:hypothetical protein